MVFHRSGDSMIWKRCITALVLMPMVFLIIRGGERYFAISIFIVAGMASLEFYSFFREFILFRFTSGFIITILIISSTFVSFQEIYPFISLILFVIFFYFLFLYKGANVMFHLGYILIGSFYIGWFLRYPILLMQKGVSLLLMALFITWANDSFAFFVGSSIGKHKLAPSLSPNKSVEGAIGGLLGAIFVSLIVGLIIGVAPIGAAILAIAGGIAAQIGDLFESKLKRLFGVKDSGFLFPGHGGVMDRIDSLLFSLPAVYYLLPLIL